MADPVKRLNGLHAPRPEQEDGQWLTFEREFGITFPRQCKNLIEEFGGTSSWANNSIHVLSPIHGGDFKLRKRADYILSADRESREHTPEFFPLPIFPEEGGLFPWAETDYATFYWITRSGSEFGPDQWPTLIRSHRSFQFEVHFEPVDRILFLCDSFQLRSTILAEE